MRACPILRFSARTPLHDAVDRLFQHGLGNHIPLHLFAVPQNNGIGHLFQSLGAIPYDPAHAFFQRAVFLRDHRKIDFLGFGHCLAGDRADRDSSILCQIGIERRRDDLVLRKFDAVFRQKLLHCARQKRYIRHAPPAADLRVQFAAKGQIGYAARFALLIHVQTAEARLFTRLLYRTRIQAHGFVARAIGQHIFMSCQLNG